VVRIVFTAISAYTFMLWVFSDAFQVGGCMTGDN
jgi:hypothetical protein